MEGSEGQPRARRMIASTLRILLAVGIAVACVAVLPWLFDARDRCAAALSMTFCKPVFHGLMALVVFFAGYVLLSEGKRAFGRKATDDSD